MVGQLITPAVPHRHTVLVVTLPAACHLYAAKIGTLLVSLGFLFLFLGVILFLDSGLLTIGNILVLVGEARGARAVTASWQVGV